MIICISEFKCSLWCHRGSQTVGLLPGLSLIPPVPLVPGAQLGPSLQRETESGDGGLLAAGAGHLMTPLTP